MIYKLQTSTTTLSTCVAVSHRRGFTLTELAIVLGVIGTILGAIWSAASLVNSSKNTQKAAGQVLLILGGYRSLYGIRGIDTPNTGNGWTDVTCMGITDGYFPADMIQPNVTCTVGTTSTYPRTPWGPPGYVQVDAFNLGTNPQGIIISYWGLTQAACNSLANSITLSPDLWWESIDGIWGGGGAPTAQWLTASGVAGAGNAWTTTQINNLCNQSGTNNSVQVLFPVS